MTDMDDRLLAELETAKDALREGGDATRAEEAIDRAILLLVFPGPTAGLRAHLIDHGAPPEAADAALQGAARNTELLRRGANKW